MLSTSVDELEDAIRSFSGDDIQINQHLRNILFGICGLSRSNETVSSGTRAIVALSENIDQRLQPYFVLMENKFGVRVDTVLDRLRYRYEMHATLNGRGLQNISSNAASSELRRLLLRPYNWHVVLKSLFYLQALNCVLQVRVQRLSYLSSDVVLEVTNTQYPVVYYGHQTCLNPLWLSTVWHAALSVFCELKHKRSFLDTLHLGRLTRGFFGMYIMEGLHTHPAPLPPPPWLNIIPLSVLSAEMSVSNLHLLVSAISSVSNCLEPNQDAHSSASLTPSAPATYVDLTCCEPIQQVRLLLLSSLWLDYALAALLISPRDAISVSAVVKMLLFAWDSRLGDAPSRGAKTVHDIEELLCSCLLTDCSSEESSSTTTSRVSPHNMDKQFEAVFAICEREKLAVMGLADLCDGSNVIRMTTSLRVLIMCALVGVLVPDLSCIDTREDSKIELDLLDRCWDMLGCLLDHEVMGYDDKGGTVDSATKHLYSVRLVADRIVSSALCFFLNTVEDICSHSELAAAIGRLVKGVESDNTSISNIVITKCKKIAILVVRSMSTPSSSFSVLIKKWMEVDASSRCELVSHVIEYRLQQCGNP